MLITFNELSVDKDFVDAAYQADDFIIHILEFMKQINGSIELEELALSSDFYLSLMDGPNGVQDWKTHRTRLTKEKQYFLIFLNKYCHVIDQYELEGELKVIVRQKEYNSPGISYAYENNHIVVSVPTHDCWKSDYIEGDYSYLDASGGMITQHCGLDNVYFGEPIDQILKIKRMKELQGITSGQDFWEKREEMFPNLVFCGNVKAQLYEDSQKYHLRRVYEKLSRMQEYFSTYDGHYDPKELGMNARTESETVKNDPELRKYRLFRLPDGREEYFYDHIGFTGRYTAGRIHFLLDGENRKCYIGYIGRHLPTKKF